jgi:hypothetical protein
MNFKMGELINLKEGKVLTNMPTKKKKIILLEQNHVRTFKLETIRQRMVKMEFLLKALILII